MRTLAGEGASGNGDWVTCAYQRVPRYGHFTGHSLVPYTSAPRDGEPSLLARATAIAIAIIADLDTTIGALHGQYPH